MHLSAPGDWLARLSAPGMRRLLLALVATVAVGRVAVTVFEGPAHLFSEHRLMPVFLALEGRPVYPPPAEGPFYVPMYPPLSFLVYLPVALSRDPVGVLRLGSAITAAAVFLPGLLFLWPPGRGRRDLAGSVLALTTLVAWVHLSPVLVSALYVHADAPALLLAGLGIWLLDRSLSRGSGPLLAAALVLCSLAPWAKQTFLPVVLLPVLALFAAGSRRRGLLALSGTVALQAIWAGLAGLAFGFRPLAFWLLEFPSRHPWIAAPWRALSTSNRILLSEGLPLLAVAVWGAVAASRREGSRAAWARTLWGLLLAAAVLLWPTSVLGYVKVGGAPNAFTPTLYFLTCSCVLLLLEASRREEPPGPRPARSVLLLLAAVLAVQTGIEGILAFEKAHGKKWNSSVVLKSVRSDPGRFYFPWYPLSTYLASGRFVDCDLGISDRKLAGIAIPRSEILARTPKELRYVICDATPCPTTLESFEVLRTSRSPQGSGDWTIHEVRRPVEP